MFDPGPRHTKFVKNGTSCSSRGTQTYGVELVPTKWSLQMAANNSILFCIFCNTVDILHVSLKSYQPLLCPGDTA